MSFLPPDRAICCRAAGALLLLNALTGCSNQLADHTHIPEVSKADETIGAKCSLASEKPFIIEWEPMDRGDLETKLREGLVVVSYSGCELKVLEDCRPPEEQYEYTSFTAKEAQRSFKTTDELYTDLSIGAAKLEAELSSRGEISLRMMIVGRYHSRNAKRLPADLLEGPSCKNATHVIRAASVGAFELDAGAGSAAKGGIAAEGVGVGTAASVERKSLNRDGSFAQCASSKRADETPPEGCGALLRLELSRIHPEEKKVVLRKRVCPSGMRLDEETQHCKVDTGGAQENDNPNRFVVQDETVFDTTTGRTWQRLPGERLPWDKAKAYCLDLELGGASDWRMPTKKELSTLVRSSPSAPQINTEVFPQTPPEAFWTFSRDRSSPGDVWTINFGTGKTESLGSGTPRLVRCVH